MFSKNNWKARRHGQVSAFAIGKLIVVKFPSENQKDFESSDRKIVTGNYIQLN